LPCYHQSRIASGFARHSGPRSGPSVPGINTRASVTAEPTSWQFQAGLLQECDVIFACIDSLIGRGELETFARRYMIPLIDIGMDVHSLDEGFVISGQIALSIPDMPCLQCMGLLSERGMREEAERYGAAGSNPQVVWPNAILVGRVVRDWIRIGIDFRFMCFISRQPRWAF
jgi:hypothetical protein